MFVRSGKTAVMLMWAAEKQGIILTSSKERARELLALAKELGVQIPGPMVLPKRRAVLGDAKSTLTLYTFIDDLQEVENAQQD